MRVLVAEDGVLMRRLMVRTLGEWGYEVAEAENGERAWQEFQQQPCQLVLTDWIMPEVDGLELIRRIRSSDFRHYVYILLLTALSEKRDLVAGMEAGADDFLVKPVDHNELRVRLRAGERIIQLEQELAEQNLQLRETQSALVQSEKLASLGQMAAGMAHELNNPLALVTNNLAVLKRDVASAFRILTLYRGSHHEFQETNASAAARIEELIEECDWEWIESESPRLFEQSLTGLLRICDIVQNLRHFARLDEAQLDRIDLRSALESVAATLRHEYESCHIALVIESEPTPLIECEPAKIQQVLHSLLLNALQASEAGGTVRIRSFPDAQRVVIEVEDHGCGIAPSDLSHIFEPFYTTRPVGSGRGLGLAISHGIVRSHGGTIEVESETGKGSTFRVKLPFGPQEKETEPTCHEG